MATFSISISIEVEAEDYDHAHNLESQLSQFIQGHDAVIDVHSIDVEQIDDEYDGQPDEAQEWADFDPDC
jgi:hypothetical protein